MCGIFFSICKNDYYKPDRITVNRLKARGPDSFHLLNIRAPEKHGLDRVSADPQKGNFYLTFVSTVLSLRGDYVQTQPLIDAATQSVFCWNGEAWKIDGHDFAGNDTYQIFQLFLKTLRSPSRILSNSQPESAGIGASSLLQRLTHVSGPYSFILYDAISSRIIYGRDCLGRRSLLIKHEDDDLVISSIRDDVQSTGWSEVATNGIQIIDLKSGTTTSICLSWDSKPSSLIPIPGMNKSVPEDKVPILGSESSVVTDLSRQLLESLRLRVTNIPDLSSLTKSALEHAKVAILFSGGLDCGLLARLVHEVLPIEEPVDLLNVAFENPRVVAAANAGSGVSPYQACPDRITGGSTYAELRRVCPGRTWRFVSIDVPYSKGLSHRGNIITLLHPHNTEMDLSIGQALYFASEGVGTVISDKMNLQVPYTSQARVLLSGLGADEIFGGYTRHTTAYARQGFLGLVDELDLDVSRIGKRNLGRDDRVISHWGKEARYPYLDESFLGWALALPVWAKCGFGQQFDGVQPSGFEPGKLLLRLLAAKLGMVNLAKEKKRAIQFGARTAKMESGKKKGTELLS